MDLNFILQHAAGNLYWKDREGRYLGANRAFLALAGLTDVSAIVGKTDRDLFSLVMSDAKLRCLEETDRRIIRSGIEESLKEEGVDANGAPAFYMTNKIPLRDGRGAVVGLMGTSLDITKELQADIARTAFLENMRHDIRTPLTGIVGFAELLKMEAPSAHVQEYADNLVASSHALLELLDEVLEAVRVSSGEIPRLRKKFNLQKTLTHIIHLYQAKAAQKRLHLSLDMDKSLPHYVVGDKIRLHRIVLELVANALNFTDEGFVKISVTLAKKQQRELILKLDVCDSGMGIPQEKQQEIYLQFKRLTPSYQGIYRGAGLGLSVVKQFIDELSGEIYVQSAPRQGTCFTCLIPLQEALLDDDSGVDETLDRALARPYEKTFAESIKPLANDSPPKTHRVLVVEDNVLAQRVSKGILAQLDCAVELAESGEKALVLWRQGNYDLIFMDIGLPDKDGYAITHLIRQEERATQASIPIIALTAHVGEENKKRCIDAGMNAVLTKPLTVKSCRDILKAFIPHMEESTLPGTVANSSELPAQEDALFNLQAYPHLDVEEALKSTGTEAVLADMLQCLLESALPEDLALMKSAHDAGDWDKTQQYAHKIKGGAMYVGAVKIKMACLYLERYWKVGHRQVLEPLYQQILTVVSQSREEILRWLKTRPNKVL